MKPLDASVHALGVALALTTAARAQTIIHIDDDAPDNGDGSTWESAFNDLQDALASLDLMPFDSVELRIAGGTYRPDSGTGDRMRSFEIDQEMLQSATILRIKGGFAGLAKLTDPDRRDMGLYSSVLDGDLNGDDLPGFGNRADNSHNILKLDTGFSFIFVDGLVVRGSWGSPCVRVAGPSVFLSRCTFTDNAGGPTVHAEPNVFFTNCSFLGNDTGLSGVLSGSGSELAGCIIAYNDAGLGAADDTIIQQSLIYGNAEFGIAANITPLVINSILWSNGDEYWRDQLGGGVPLFCIIQGYGTHGHGNHSRDPRFIDELGPDGVRLTGDEDLRVRYHSPARDTALMGLLPHDYTDLDADGDIFEPIPVDLSHQARILNRSLDIGPYEICPADMTGSSLPGDPTYDIPDGDIDADDWFFFLDVFSLIDERADFTGSSNPDDPTWGIPDGNIGVDDYFFFLDAFARGCAPE